MIGEATARDLAAFFGSLDRIVEASQEQLLQVDDVGPVVAASIRSFFAQPHNREVVEQLRAAGIRWHEHEGAASAAPKPLAGLTVVLTGTLLALTREQAKGLLEAAGAKVTTLSPGDEVVVPAYGFIATPAAAMRAAGGCG